MQHLFSFLVIILWLRPYEKEGEQEQKRKLSQSLTFTKAEVIVHYTTSKPYLESHH